jgi:hypothetical protein
MKLRKDSPPLSTEGVKRIQDITGTLLYYAHAGNSKLLATLSTLSSQQATATEATNVAMNQLLDYLATYPDDSTTYHASDMILCAHDDAGFHNESKGHSQAGAHIFVSKNKSFSKHNGLVLSIYQIMKFVMSSAAKAELGSTPPPRKWSPSVKPSSKWVGRNHACPSKWTTPLPLDHQPHHCPAKNQVHGSLLMVALLPRISTTFPLLLG